MGCLYRVKTVLPVFFKFAKRRLIKKNVTETEVKLIAVDQYFLKNNS